MKKEEILKILQEALKKYLNTFNPNFFLKMYIEEREKVIDEYLYYLEYNYDYFFKSKSRKKCIGFTKRIEKYTDWFLINYGILISKIIKFFEKKL